MKYYYNDPKDENSIASDSINSIYKDKKRAISSFRLSLSELVTYEEIDYLVETLKELAK